MNERKGPVDQNFINEKTQIPNQNINQQKEVGEATRKL